tara:strand:+ start:1381 stop:1587 length:207 start_codon:yes stop_codon:yes gene_type:complete
MDLKECILLSGNFLLTLNIFFFLLGVFVTYLCMNYRNKKIIKQQKLFEFQKGLLQGWRQCRDTVKQKT